MHHRLQQRGLCLLHAGAEGEPSRHFEGQLVGVDIVIAAVVDGGAEVDDRIACKIAACRRFLHALFNRGNELPRNRAAEDVVHELESAPTWKRFNAQLAVAKLSMSAGLLFMPPMAAGTRANGLPIGNLRRLERDLRMKPAAQPGHNRLDVKLSCARY